MAALAMENIYDILSRMPVKSLARFRCVSKLWRNYIDDPHLQIMHSNRADPMLIMFHHFPNDIGLYSSCTISFLEYNEQALQVTKKPPVMEFMCGHYSYRHFFSDDIILGSCNGLFYSSEYHCDTGICLLVIHPLRKEYYMLPPIMRPLRSWGVDMIELDERRFLSVQSTGLGFDDSTNTFKMVAVVERREHSRYAMVHVLGTDSWRKITQSPSCPLRGEGVYANGCLHWFGRSGIVISFDMANEEFGSINPPPRERPSYNWSMGHLVNLHGQLGYVQHNISINMELWVLKDRGWVMHSKFFRQQFSPFPISCMKILGFCNENEDLFMTNYENNKIFVYNLKGESLHQVSLVGHEDAPKVYSKLYQSSLFSIRYSIKY